MRTKNSKTYHFLFNCFTLLVMMSAVVSPQPATASHTSDPSTVTIVGSLQTVLGCVGDWAPGCSETHLAYDSNDDVWQGVWVVPDGYWEYKAALNGTWDENYGLHAAPGGANISLPLGSSSSVKFYYDHKTHWITDNQGSVIATAVGGFQTELGCSGDWDPGCLRSWLQDPDGDGIYNFETTALPVGTFEAKVAINESWAENYGAGGTPGGANIPFTIAVNGSTATFTYNSTTHVLEITVQAPSPQLDNNVQWDGLRHDSRDLLYRTPGGAVPAGTNVILRFRTFHNDVNRVQVRLYDINAGEQTIADMTIAASDVSCYQELAYTCDYWEYTVSRFDPNNLWYRFLITDGTKTVYYADNTPALDGGIGSPSDNLIDNSYALMFYDSAFSTPAWAQDAVIYQIFPDRFRDGRKDNNPKSGDIRYDDPVLKLSWGTNPEGYCRNYADGTTNCPWRFGAPAGDPSTKESPRGRDYFGGDLKGVDQNLEYLQALGVNTLYFNPIFAAGSNHGYDTQDYFKVDPYFGSQKDWDNLVKHARQLGIRIILDGVYNHMSSDSPFFDRYHHYAMVGACESLESPYRSWFTFHDVAAGTGTCVGTAGPNSATYDGWFGFDSIPVLNKSLAEIQQYFLTNKNSVTNYWLIKGASGWRMDVMGDASFPSGYWEIFRDEVKDTKPDALIVGELWQKDSTLLRFLRGDKADTTMNYRLRDAVVGFLTPGPFDSKGFADSGHSITATEFANRLASIREDYPDPAFYTLMNLLDSHDTERLLWTLTPGMETTADKELNAANLAVGKHSQQIASLIQFTLPGAPTIFYGDEVALTGDDDPDDRRTYPWADLGGMPDENMFKHYQTLATLRKDNPALTDGDFHVLFADDATEVVVYGRKTTSQAALVLINRSNAERIVTITVADYLPDDLILENLFGVVDTTFEPTPVETAVMVENGFLTFTLGPQSAWLLASGEVDLEPTAAPTGLMVANEGNGTLNLQWNSVSGAVGYNLYRSPVSGGGWVKLNASILTDTTFNDTGLENTRIYYYVATALDEAGNESAYSNEASGMPHLTIGWANLQWPPTMTHTISAINRTDTAYGQVWIDGETNQPGPTPGLLAQLGYGPVGSNPDGNPAWIWVDAAFNVNAGNNDEFKASLLPETVGNFEYVYRYSTTNGMEWLYADLNGPIPPGSLPPNPGKLTVISSGDTTPPAAPTGLMVVSASPTAIDLTWNDVMGDPTLYGYEVLRSEVSGGPYELLARVVGGAAVTDPYVAQGMTYYYVVRSIDTSFNFSGYSAEVSAKAELRTVTVTFNVTVPATTDGTGRSVYIAGFLDRLDGNLPQWNPGGVMLTRVDATHWTITLTGKEYTQLEYKYAMGSWDYVEKGSSCDELSNRQLTLSYGTTGIQTVNDTVLNWRNISPCGN